LQYQHFSFILGLAIFSESGVKNMANIKSAKKRIGVIAKKTATNRRVKDHLKAVIKNFEKALIEGDLTVAGEKLTLAEKKLRKAAAKNTIHKNAASRKVSRLTKRFNAAKAK
jgi:small subunit ribosomal protein S20